jgi:hypothetical protein
MKKFFTYFFVTLGVIFFILICAAVYVWFADPFGIRPIVEMMTEDRADNSAQRDTFESEVDKNPALSPEHEKALETIGIDPAKLPTTITPEMEVCFTEKLGATRVLEIKGGAEPTPSEVFSARSCYE